MRWLAAWVLVFLFSVTSSINVSSDCVCGERGSTSKLDLKIAGGKDAGVNEFPWAALLLIADGGKPRRCGGSLINDRYCL